MLKLQTLGLLSLRDEDGNEASAVLSQPKRLGLLIYLALARPRGPHRRDLLLTLFWPERPGTQGRNSLSQSLSFLRQKLPEPVLPSSAGEAVGLEPGAIVSDVEAFEAAIDDGRWLDALDLYRGEFLRGFHIGGAWGFEDWVGSERERLREMAAGAAWSLAHEQVRRGALVEGERTAQKALGFVSTDETPLRRFIEALAKAGDKAAALTLYEKFCSRLREDLELEPSAQTEAVAEAIRNGDVGDFDPAAPSEPGSAEGERTQLSTKGPSPSEAVWAGRSPAPVPEARTKRQLPLAFLGGAATLAAALVAYTVIWGGNTPDLDRNLVLIPPFENRTGQPDLEDWAAMATEWVAEGAEQVDSAHVVPLVFAREVMAGRVGDEFAKRIRDLADQTKAGWVLSGAMVDLGDSLDFRVEIIDAAQWTRKQSVVVAGPKGSPGEAIGELASRVSGRLGYEFDPLMEELTRGGQYIPMPPKIEAFREHRLGYEAYDRQDWDASFNHHLAAYALDSTLVRALVAAAYMTPDYSVKDSLAQYANERRHMLSRRGQHDLDILLPLAQNDLQGVLVAMRRDAAMNRTGFSAVTHAWAAIVVNQPGEAVEALSHFDPYPEWRRAGAHSYWQYLTWALHMLGEYERELTEARAGRDLYPVRADLLGSEVRSLAALGRVDEVVGLLNEASGLLDDPVPAMLVAGEELRAHGHLQGSKVAYGLAIDWLNAMPPVAAADSTHRRYFAEALYGSERWEDAHQVALTLAQEAPDDVAPLGMVGSTAARLGDSVLAKEISDQLAAMDHRKRRGEHSHLRACISALLGEPDEAIRLLRQAFSEGKRYFPSVFREMDLESLRDRAGYQALMRPKG